MRPAYQRFGADQALAAQAKLGLVVQAQFVALQSAAQFLFHGHALVDLEGQRAGIELAAVTALGLGLVHGRVGVLDQGGDVEAVLGVEADADAGADEELVVVELERCAEAFEQFLRDLFGVLRLVQAGQQDDEFVAAETGHGVDIAQLQFQACGDGLEQLVADRVAEAVVDLLETVEIEKQHGAELVVGA